MDSATHTWSTYSLSSPHFFDLSYRTSSDSSRRVDAFPDPDIMSLIASIMSSPTVERRIGLRRLRSSSPSNQLHREKRQRTSRQARFSPPLLVNRPNPASSSAASIGQYYGIGDEDTLSNLFTSYPQTFSTFHGLAARRAPTNLHGICGLITRFTFKMTFRQGEHDFSEAEPLLQAPKSILYLASGGRGVNGS